MEGTLRTGKRECKRTRQSTRLSQPMHLIAPRTSPHLVAFDRAGYGESDPNPGRNVKSEALDIEELADKLDLGEKFYVLGVSMGGYSVWGCLQYMPHRQEQKLQPYAC